MLSSSIHNYTVGRCPPPEPCCSISKVLSSLLSQHKQKGLIHVLHFIPFVLDKYRHSNWLVYALEAFDPLHTETDTHNLPWMTISWSTASYRKLVSCIINIWCPLQEECPFNWLVKIIRRGVKPLSFFNQWEGERSMDKQLGATLTTSQANKFSSHCGQSGGRGGSPDRNLLHWLFFKPISVRDKRN